MLLFAKCYQIHKVPANSTKIYIENNADCYHLELKFANYCYFHELQGIKLNFLNYLF